LKRATPGKRGEVLRMGKKRGGGFKKKGRGCKRCTKKRTVGEGVP